MPAARLACRSRWIPGNVNFLHCRMKRRDMNKRSFHPLAARLVAASLIILLVLANLPAIPAGAAAPVVNTMGATGVKRTGAILNGSVNSSGEDTTVTFQYGPTTSYGSTIAATPGTVLGTTTTDTLVSAQISGFL